MNGDGSGAMLGAVAGSAMTAGGGAGGNRVPRLGFVGTGWIGRHRLEALAASGLAEIAAVADPSPAMRDATRESAPGADRFSTLQEILSLPLDGVVIATPSALHAEQTITALESGLPVFCQKPLGRTAGEVEQVVAAAERNDLLLGVDLSYRSAASFERLREVVATGGIGSVFAADLLFHNAYGPDKDWFYDPRLAGGGCVIDLGVHLVDMALWVLGFPAVAEVSSRLFAGGQPLRGTDRVEDYGAARIDLVDGTTIQIACSWNLPAGQDSVISATFYGTEGGVCVRNLDGSFYDFVAERYHGTARQTLVMPPDDWGGRAAVAWARRLGHDRSFDRAAREFITVASVIDRIYGR